MATVTMKGKAVHTGGELPSIGSKAPNFTGTQRDMTELALSELKGKNVILNVFPSLDTEVCATSVRKFNKEATSLHNTVVLVISKDLPFAQGRFCTTEGIERVMPLSVFRDTSFEEKYGMLLEDGPLKGLLARGVIVVNEAGEVVYTELVPEIAQEPNYEAALACIR
ncbi:MAG: thiol peroxidase [Tannerellaceae bacterium]|nr:thiol peroxidase [Tannerellaceae bacterium]